MAVETRSVKLRTQGETDIRDITGDVQRLVKESKIDSGTATVFVPGSTGGLTTIEYEDGVLRDLSDLFDRIVPRDIRYLHDDRWGDGNGYSHVRSALLGPSLTVPFARKKLLLGTWQQIVLLDFDNRPRSRELIVQIMGD